MFLHWFLQKQLILHLLALLIRWTENLNSTSRWAMKVMQSVRNVQLYFVQHQLFFFLIKLSYGQFFLSSINFRTFLFSTLIDQTGFPFSNSSIECITFLQMEQIGKHQFTLHYYHITIIILNISLFQVKNHSFLAPLERKTALQQLV